MKKIYIIILFLFFGVNSFAVHISLKSAEKVAVNYYKHYNAKIQDYTIADVIAMLYEGDTTFYVFVFKSGGYVMIAADDASVPVLGFSADKNFDKNNIPPNAQLWYNNQYSRQIKYIIDSDLDNSQTIKEWDKIRNNYFTDDESKDVGPLCTTIWDQGCYYNALCPVDAGSCGRTYTGCMATAMAQIMKYWNYPATGTGSNSYNHPDYGVLSANFGATTYDWGVMPDYVSSSNTAVATLMYHCGISVYMYYSPDGSGSQEYYVSPALINYFNYQSTAELKYKSEFSSANWINLLKADLDASRPMLYCGYDNSAGGHAFVCDGYNSSNQFHFNWGWSGSGDGYYTIGSLNPASYQFNYYNCVICRIQPPDLNNPVAMFTASTTIPAVGSSVDFTDHSTNNPTSWSWSFQGGSPSTSTEQNPQNITYSTAGKYQVSLTAVNANGQDTKVKTKYINVGGTPTAWEKQNSGFTTPSRGINQIFIVNPYVVWAKAYDGTDPANVIREFTRTNNGGIDWTPGTISFTGSDIYGVANIFAFKDTVAFAAMYPTGDNGGVIVKTTNGGTSWSIANSPDFSSSWLDFIHFFNNSDGVCVGDPSGSEYVIYTTTNGGSTWTVVSGANIPDATTGETAIVNYFDTYQNTIWFSTTKGRVYKSTDKGYTWTVSSTGLNTYTNVIFKDDNVGFALRESSPYTIKKTTNGGTSWTTVYPSGYYVKSPNLDYVPGTPSTWVDVSGGPGKGSSYSINDCSSFLNIDTGSVQYTCVKFYDMNTGWAGGFNTDASDGGIYKWDTSMLVLALKEISAPEKIKIYPNPTNSIVNIELDAAAKGKACITLYNIFGEKLFSKDYNLDASTWLQMDMSDNSTGIYLLTIDTGKKIITRRISLIR